MEQTLTDKAQGVTETYDAVVVGAGPAGSTLSRLLALKGWRVLLVDQDVPGRKKVCGGFLGPEVNRLWPELELENNLGPWFSEEIRTLIVSGVRTRCFETAFSKGAAMAVDRGLWDTWLYDLAGEAGVFLSPRTKLAGQKRLSGSWQIGLEHDGVVRLVSTSILVKAHGRRQAKMLSADQGRIFFACKTVYEHITNLERSVALHFVRKGHVGLNSLGAGRATMCLYVEGSYLKKAKGDLDRMMQTLIEENTNLKRHLSSARRAAPWQSCQAQPDGRKIFYEDDMFFVGDALTMASPVVGGGIPIAMGSAAILANCLTEGREKKYSHEKIAARYEHLWRERFDGRVAFAARIGRLERSVWLTRLTFGFIKIWPRLFAWLVRSSRPGSFRAPEMSRSPHLAV